MTKTQGTTALGSGAAPGAPADNARPSGATGASTNPVDTAAQVGIENLAHDNRPAVGRASVPVDHSADGMATAAHHVGTAAVPVAPTAAVAVAAPPGGSTASGVTVPADSASAGIGAGATTGVGATASMSTAAGGGTAVDAPSPDGALAGSTTAATTGHPGAGVVGARMPIGTMPGRPFAPRISGARIADAIRSARATSSAAAARGPRRARLTIRKVDPWSVMKFSFAVSLVLFVVTIVATAVLYLALDRMGVFDSVNQSLGDLVVTNGDANESSGFKITAKSVLGTAALLGIINVVLITALATLGAFIYNVCADLVGGIEVTLSERD